MRHTLEMISDGYVVVLSAIVSLAICIRIAVFCYWWISGAWEEEQDSLIQKRRSRAEEMLATEK